MFSPDRATFHKAAASGANLIPLAQSWPADLETPLTAWIKAGSGHPPGVLLESVEGGENAGDGGDGIAEECLGEAML